MSLSAGFIFDLARLTAKAPSMNGRLDHRAR
jgi:hypothetical protein